jgi:hypothetical protein
MSTIAIEGDVFVEFLLVIVAVITVIENDRMDEAAKRAMTDVVTACDEAQDKESIQDNKTNLLEVHEDAKIAHL